MKTKSYFLRRGNTMNKTLKMYVTYLIYYLYIYKCSKQIRRFYFSCFVLDSRIVFNCNIEMEMCDLELKIEIRYTINF